MQPTAHRPPPPTANSQPVTANNHEPPTAAYRQPPPTANRHQPPMIVQWCFCGHVNGGHTQSTTVAPGGRRWLRTPFLVLGQVHALHRLPAGLALDLPVGALISLVLLQLPEDQMRLAEPARDGLLRARRLCGQQCRGHRAVLAGWSSPSLLPAQLLCIGSEGVDDGTLNQTLPLGVSLTARLCALGAAGERWCQSDPAITDCIGCVFVGGTIGLRTPCKDGTGLLAMCCGAWC